MNKQQFKISDKTKAFFNENFQELELTPAPTETKKFNLRLNNEDIEFIDFLCKKQNMSRSQIIDDLISMTIVDFLSSLNKEELALLVRNADALNGFRSWDNLEASWISEIYPLSLQRQEVDDALHNISSDPQHLSERYKHMAEAIRNSKLMKDQKITKSEELPNAN